MTVSRELPFNLLLTKHLFAKTTLTQPDVICAKLFSKLMRLQVIFLKLPCYHIWVLFCCVKKKNQNVLDFWSNLLSFSGFLVFNQLLLLLWKWLRITRPNFCRRWSSYFLWVLFLFFLFFHKIIINLWMTYEDSLASISFAAQYVFTLFHETRLNMWEDDRRFT